MTHKRKQRKISASYQTKSRKQWEFEGFCDYGAELKGAGTINFTILYLAWHKPRAENINYDQYIFIGWYVWSLRKVTKSVGLGFAFFSHQEVTIYSFRAILLKSTRRVFIPNLTFMLFN